MDKLKFPDPWWFTCLKEGDVLKINGSYRIVRKASYLRGKLFAVCFAIRHRSWTRRPYTTWMVADLRRAKIDYIGARVKLDSKLDHLIAEDIKDAHARRIFWHHVKGIP